MTNSGLTWLAVSMACTAACSSSTTSEQHANKVNFKQSIPKVLLMAAEHAHCDRDTQFASYQEVDGMLLVTDEYSVFSFDDMHTEYAVISPHDNVKLSNQPLVLQNLSVDEYLLRIVNLPSRHVTVSGWLVSGVKCHFAHVGRRAIFITNFIKKTK